MRIDNYSCKSLRDSVSYVSNDSSIFSGTISANLLLGNQECSDEEMRRVCDVTGVTELMDHLPGDDGFAVEENGSNLSNGQRQRIAIARALMKKPRLLILDEATANLDTGAETQMLDAIAAMDPDLVILLITHRISSVKNFDQIIVMKDGRITGSRS